MTDITVRMLSCDCGLCWRSSVCLFCFQELNFNFHTIILPEALKTIQTEEPTVLAMVNELDIIIAGVGCPLEDLLAQLEMHLRYTIMEMDVSFILKLLRERMRWVVKLIGIYGPHFLFEKVIYMYEGVSKSPRTMLITRKSLVVHEFPARVCCGGVL